MPQQELFFEQKIGGRRIEVLKTYDTACAREAFGNMDAVARAFLWKSLGIDGAYEQADIPPIQSGDGEDFLWEELLENSREDGNLHSFFLVTEAKGASSRSLYVSPDWPSAEAFAQNVLAGA
ncbi:MAG: hypothetical protein ABR976_19745 [Terracidiphilus sp.]|jgi:hypothetical protein